ncbi:MAG: adenylate/guanylate cyclase domain-containing protein, partial [Mycobacterium sp.]
RSLSVKEDLLTEQRSQIHKLLSSLMPAPIAAKVFDGAEITARDHPNVTVVYADVTGLDRIQAELDAGEYLDLWRELIRQYDAAAAEFDVERVHQVRNGFLGSCGLTVPRLDNVRQTVDFALECQRIIERFNGEAGLNLGLRAGIDTGTVSSGLVAEPSPVFDMWGTAVTLAHRIKNGVPASGIYVTSRVVDVLSEAMSFTQAGNIEVNGAVEPIWRVEDTQ